LAPRNISGEFGDFRPSLDGFARQVERIPMGLPLWFGVGREDRQTRAASQVERAVGIGPHVGDAVDGRIQHRRHRPTVRATFRHETTVRYSAPVKVFDDMERIGDEGA